METQVQQSVEVTSAYSSGGDSTEPTQQLLTALGCFQRQLTDAHSATSSTWSDECMNQLITAVDVALTQGWASIVEALTDAGRILQTYKNANRAQDSVPFLNDAYEVLCLMVGDLIVDNHSDALLTNWRKLYSGAVRAVEDTGLVLARDDETGSEPSIDSAATLEIRLPEGMVESVGIESSDSDGLPMLDELSPLDGPVDKELETHSIETPEPDTSLDELGDTELASPDEILLESNESAEIVPEQLEDPLGIEEPVDPPVIEVSVELDEGPPEISADVLEVEEPADPLAIEVSVELDEGLPEISADVLEVEEPADPLAIEVSVELDEGPPEISADVLEVEELAELPAKEAPSAVVQILDRISEQLAALQNASGETQDFALERLQGGFGALTRAANEDGHDVAGRLSVLMASVCDLAAQADEKSMERVIELGYAFCGTYMEAAEQGETASVRSWKSECQVILDEFKPDAPTDTLSVESSPEIEVVDTLDEVGIGVEEIDKEETPVSEIEVSDEVSEEWMLLEPKNSSAATVTEESEPSASPESVVESAPSEVPEISEEPVVVTKYSELLASAQEAALKGDRAAAQYFALQAAAHIAHTDVEKAQEHLGKTEGRLKDSLTATETASNEVKEAESRAREISTEVVSAEKSVAKIKKAENGITKEVQDIQASISDLDQQIQELEAQRSEKAEECKEAEGRLADAENTTKQTKLELEESKKSEEDSRNYLERCRQHVKDEQEITEKVELEVQEAREHLARHEHSSEEINDTISKTCGDEVPTSPEDTAGSMLF